MLHEELPALPDSVRWLDRPALPVPSGLRDHVVAVLFWRLGCVHSRLALAETARLAERFAAQPFVALALHVPLHEGERDDARVQAAVAGHRLLAAVDEGRVACRHLAVRRLPTLLLLDPRGHVRRSGHGEPERDALQAEVAALLREQQVQGNEPLVPCVPVARQQTRLSPRGLLAHGDRIWCAAAGHHRVLELTRDGTVRRTFGSGLPGDADGPSATARFRAPAGLVAVDGRIAVADAEGHLLRAIDVRTGGVETWCGTGRRSSDRFGGGFGTQQALAAPVGLAALHGGLCLTQHGTHQLWQFDPATGAASAWLGAAGGGGPLRDGGEEATFLEPSGLAATAQTLFVADTGHGAVRAVDLAHAHTRTIAQGLLRPVALAAHADLLFVADAWRPAILRVAASGGPPQAWLGASDGLVEPAALAVVGDELWIADAGADALFAVPLAGPPQLRRIELSGLPDAPAPVPPSARLCEPLELLEFSDVTLRVQLPLPDGAMLDPSLPCTVHATDEGRGLLACECHAAGTLEGDRVAVLVAVAEAGAGALRLRVEATLRTAASGTTSAWVCDLVAPLAVHARGALDAAVVPSAGS